MSAPPCRLASRRTLAASSRLKLKFARMARSAPIAPPAPARNLSLMFAVDRTPHRTGSAVIVPTFLKAPQRRVQLRVARAGFPVDRNPLVHRLDALAHPHRPRHRVGTVVVHARGHAS